MHSYANQVSYTQRKYGYDLNGVSESWRKHLDDYAGEVIRYLLCAKMCLPSEKGDDGKTSIKFVTVTMPSGEKWTAVFTDVFAMRRYMGSVPQSIVFPGLVSDLAMYIRSGKMQGLKGIMVNPGREEFKMTPEAIEEQEKWLKNNPGKRIEYEDGWSNFGAPESVREIVQRAERVAGQENKTGDAASDVFRKIDLTALDSMQTVAEEFSFFTGLLDDEKAYGDKTASGSGPDHPGTNGFVKIGKLCAEAGDQYFYYDPKYRRFVTDHYEEAEGEKKYCGRETAFPQDLIDRIDGDTRYFSSEKEVVTDKILEIMAEEDGFGLR